MKAKPTPIRGARKSHMTSTTPRPSTPCCPTCARPLPVDDWTLILSPLERRIYNLVSRRAEIDSEILYTAIYGSNPDAPDPKSIDVTITNMNKKIYGWGQVIQRRSKAHRGQPWCLMQIGEAAE
jgi:hypothetical protein